MLRLQQGQNKKKQAEAQIELSKNHLKLAMGGRTKLLGALGSCTWRTKKDSSHVDWRAVAEELGATDALIEKHTTLRPGPREFRTNFGKAALEGIKPSAAADKKDNKS